MTGFAARGHSLRVVRTCIEATVLLVGWLLGGTVGVGAVAYAVCIGPLAHIFVPLFSQGDDRSRVRSETAAWLRRPRPDRRPPACGRSSP